MIWPWTRGVPEPREDDEEKEASITARKKKQSALSELTETIRRIGEIELDRDLDHALTPHRKPKP